MMKSHDHDTIQNLRDAGCTEKTIREFLECTKTCECLKTLETHRKQLVDEMHHCCRKIDTLDYLVYQIQKEEKR